MSEQNADSVPLPNGKWMTMSKQGSGTYFYVWRHTTDEERPKFGFRVLVDNYASHMEPLPLRWPEAYHRAMAWLEDQSGRQEGDRG